MLVHPLSRSRAWSPYFSEWNSIRLVEDQISSMNFLTTSQLFLNPQHNSLKVGLPLLNQAWS